MNTQLIPPTSVRPSPSRRSRRAARGSVLILVVALLVLMALIFGLDYVFGKAVFFLFKT